MPSEMLRFQVDLRPYSGEEYERRRKLLENYSSVHAPYLEDPQIYDVYWDRKETIESVINVPSHLVCRLGCSI